MPNNSVSVIKENTNGDLWIGTGSGISVFDGNNFTNYNPGNSDLPNPFVFDITFDNTIIWIATNGGLTKIDGSSWYTYNMQNSDLPLNLLRSVAIKSSTEVFIGVAGQGIAQFNPTTSEWVHFNFSNSNLPNNYVNKVTIDFSNKVWIATENGIAVY